MPFFRRNQPPPEAWIAFLDFTHAAINNFCFETKFFISSSLPYYTGYLYIFATFIANFTLTAVSINDPTKARERCETAQCQSSFLDAQPQVENDRF